MFTKLFTRKAKYEDIKRYVDMEYRPEEREVAMNKMLRQAGL